jgi:hypothetical protein
MALESVMTQLISQQSICWADYPNRISYFRKEGWTGDHVHPTTYTAYGGRCKGGFWYRSTGLLSSRPEASTGYPYLAKQFGLNSGEPSFLANDISRCYEGLRNKLLGDQGALGAFLAESGEAAALIAVRAGSLWQAYKSLRRGRFGDFLDQLEIKPKRKHRYLLRNQSTYGPKLVGNLWLEYWFGWAPSVHDMYTAGKIIDQDVPFGKATKTSSPVFKKVVKDPYVPQDVTTETARVRIRMGGSVKVTNPNLFLLNRMGVLNPASVLWEVVPGSFVVDWFTHFGNFLSGLTDWAGVEVFDEYFTSSLTNVWTRTNHPFYYTGQWEGQQWAMYRKLYLPKPMPYLTRTGGMEKSITRAGTALALLTSGLSGHFRV